MMREGAEYYIVWMDRKEIPHEIAGPFWTIEQCKQVVESLRPLYRRLHDGRLCFAGGQRWSINPRTWRHS